MPALDATIYLIRHAERPAAGLGGVDEHGATDDKSLIPRGWRRAGAWAVYFGPGGQLPSPRQIFAAGDQKEKTAQGDKFGSHSRRPIQTVAETTQRLGVGTPDITYTKGQEQNLVDAVGKLEGVTLICWQHEAIPLIARLLVGPDGVVPAAWPDDRFDVVWRFRRMAEVTTWSFDQICPQLLSGDLAAPIASGA